MKLYRVLLGLTVAAAIAGPAPAEEPTGVRVEKLAVGTAIDNRELTGAADRFDTVITRLYAWTKVSASPVPATIKHVWYADDKVVADVPLTLNYPSMRTWSSKNVWAGSWRIDVVDEAGKVLESKAFTVAQGSGAGAPAPTTAAPAATQP